MAARLWAVNQAEPNGVSHFPRAPAAAGMGFCGRAAYNRAMTRKPTHTPKDSHYATLRRTFRDTKALDPDSTATTATAEMVPENFVRLYGLHTVRAAINNPKRKIARMWATRNALERLEVGAADTLQFPVEIVEPRDIDRLSGGEAVHQGVLIEIKPLVPKSLDRLGDTPLVLVLDQVTDPHNVGAILRSAVAFGAGALVTTSRHSPHESGVLAKSASGALEHIDLIEVRNLSDALGRLAGAGFHTIGLDSEGSVELEHAFAGEKIALVLGAEGKGLRQKTRETVAALARLDLPGEISSLNVSNAAAVSLYVARRFLLSATAA